MGGSAYQYDALGHRIQQTVGGNVTRYLNDLGGGLPTVLSETNGANVIRCLHGPRGLHQLQTPAGVWQHAFADALGSLRLVTDSAAAVLDSRSYGIYGDLFGQAGSAQTGYGYSGEPTDLNGLVYDRARYFSPALGQFPSLDPLEVFNRYAYVNGNPVMMKSASVKSCGSRKPPPGASPGSSAGSLRSSPRWEGRLPKRVAQCGAGKGDMIVTL